MILNRTSILLSGFLLLLGACTYTNSDFYWVDPVPGDPASIEVTTSLDSMDNPTINDTLDLLVMMDVEVTNGELYFIECFMDDIPVYDSLIAYENDTANTSHIFRDTFEIQRTIALDSGYYSLFMYFYYSKNSNSLADIYGYEAKALEIEYDIYLEGGPE